MAKSNQIFITNKIYRGQGLFAKGTAFTVAIRCKIRDKCFILLSMFETKTAAQ